MKVLLINQPWICDEKEYGLRCGVRWAMIRKRDRTMPYYAFPFPLAYATSYLRSQGVEALLRDSITLEETRASALDFIRREAFDAVVLDTSTASIYVDMAFADGVKDLLPGAVVCMSGQHATAMPEEVLQRSRADYVLVGEYEKTLLDLVKALEARTPTDALPGIAFRRGEGVVNNGRNTPVCFNDLPPPFRDKALVRKYNEPSAKGFPNLPMMTSRGCSFRCTFCVEAKLNYGRDSFFRYRSMPRVIEEMRSLVEEYGVKEIFLDDAFVTAKRADEISQAIIDSGLKLTWSCWIDRTASEKTLRAMKASGCTGVKFGVETFDEAIGSAARKRVLPQMVSQLMDRCRRLGLRTHATYVLGLPGETPATIDHTIRTAMALNTSTSQFSIVTPLPGTELFDQAKANGWLSTLQWDKYEGQSSAVLRYDRLTPRDLEQAMTRVRKLKILQLLRRPTILIPFIWKLLRLMGVRRLLRDIVLKTRFLILRQKTA